MTRLPKPEQDEMTPEQRAQFMIDLFSGFCGAVQGPLAIWLTALELADRAQQLGVYCRYGSSLPRACPNWRS